ncbi:MAG: hypothetical protein ABL958_13785 [Bdellovibrionia bacterium]
MADLVAVPRGNSYAVVSNTPHTFSSMTIGALVMEKAFRDSDVACWTFLGDQVLTK